jgi:hypothetical protein
MKRRIIGLCGFLGSGKGTVSDILVSQHGFTKLSFADALKDGVSAIFNWPRELLEGDTAVSREWRDQPVDFWTQEMGRDITPRLVIQLFGTDCMRQGFDSEIWVNIVKRKIIDNPETDYVIPDVRFYNERSMLRLFNGEVWRVKRGKDPEWVTHAISDNRYDTHWMDEYPAIHQSEYRWLDYPTEFERFIPNDSDLDALRDEIKRAVSR